MVVENRIQATAGVVEPFLKWPGGKRLLAPALLRYAPKKFSRYYEPFVGSGAVFFALRPPESVLADTNSDLIECYEQIRDNCEEVIRQLRRLNNSESDYYRVRKTSPTQPAARAARLIYLVKLAFNGIYRVNRGNGRFNVPYGRRTERQVLSEDVLRAASAALARVKVLALDFEEAVRTAKEGDFVYFDPPYTLAHTDNGFVRYNKRLFSWPDQERLAKCAIRLAHGGVHVMVTNAPHRSIVDLYMGFNRIRLKRPSQIAADPSFRGTVTELVLTANM